MLVAYAFRRADGVITAQRIFSAFVYGGLLGVLGTTHSGRNHAGWPVG